MKINLQDNFLRKPMISDSFAWLMLIIVWGLLALSHTNSTGPRSLDNFSSGSYEWSRSGACWLHKKRLV